MSCAVPGRMSPGPKVEIKRARFSDAEEFLRLEAKCFGIRYNPITVYYWRPIIDHCWAFEAVSNRTIIGGIIAIPTRKGQIYINSLFVDGRHRRSGIGGRLLSRVLRLKPTHGFVLDVKIERAELRRYYQARGFKEARVERSYYGDESARLIMSRR